jgi:hypothetical protein
MRAIRIAAGLAALSLFFVPSIWAQEKQSGKADGEAVGLLVARVAHERNPDAAGNASMVAYETLWIVRDGSGAHIAAKLPDIVVPRKSGFWRLGIAHMCQLARPATNDSNDHGNIRTDEVAYATPVLQRPVVEIGNHECDAKTKARLFDDSYDADYVPDPDKSPAPAPDAPTECGWTYRWFESVLPDLVSVSMFQGAPESCTSEGGNLYNEIWVQKPDDPFPVIGPDKAQIPFDVLFGAASHDAWLRAVSGGKPGADSCVGYDDSQDMQQTGWALVHAHGEWRTRAFVQVGRVCAATGDPKMMVPRSVTHATPPPVAWGELQKQMPGIWDAYFSPNGSVILAIQATQPETFEQPRITTVALYAFSGGRIGEKLLDLPPTKIVMVEWATGRFVENWTRTLEEVQTKGLPVTAVQVDETAK